MSGKVVSMKINHLTKKFFSYLFEDQSSVKKFFEMIFVRRTHKTYEWKFK